MAAGPSNPTNTMHVLRQPSAHLLCLAVALLAIPALSGCTAPPVSECTGSAAAAAPGGGQASASGRCGGCEGTAADGGMAYADGDCDGCAGSGSAASGSAQASGGCDGALRDVEVYAFAATVTGTDPPSPTGEGGVNPDSTGKTDTFTVANGTRSLVVKSEVWGAGVGRVEIRGADGAMVYHSYDWTCAGGPGFSTCHAEGSEVGTAQEAPAGGTYVVAMFVAGQLDVQVSVVATVPVQENMDPAAAPF